MLSNLLLVCGSALLQLPAGEDPAERFGERWTTEARVYWTAGPAVVSIDVSGPTVAYDAFLTPVRRRASLGQGTGVVIDPAGLVITNAHVAVPLDTGASADEVQCEVSFAEEFGGRRYPAEVLSLDREWDLALLRIDGSGPFHAVPLGRSDNLIKGEKVIAIGIPYGNSHTVTSGILSGVHRKITVSTPRGQQLSLSGLLQTDAAINPGNSGGPLLNVDGELIGLNNATMLGADGISFSIPVDRVREILGERLLNADHSQRLWAGMKVEEQEGNMVVTALHPRGPAARAGMQRGDRIVRIDGETVSTPQDYARLLLSHQPAERAQIQVDRQGRAQTVALELLPAEARESYGLLGFEAERVMVYTGRGWERRGMPVLRVTRVYEGTGADRVGLRVGDVILAVRLANPPDGGDGWRPVRSFAELVSLVRGPNLVLRGENLWILRGEESYQLRLSFDDPDLAARL